MDEERTYTAFAGDRCVAGGDLRTLLTQAKQQLDQKGDGIPLLIFDDASGRQVDFDFSGSLTEVLARAEPPVRSGPGRPKLGVVSREVSLLPRQWEWLEQQPQGISGALRRLIDEARKRAPQSERARLAREATSKIMWSLAGNLEGFEEASRALFAGKRSTFERLIRRWPSDLRAYVRRIAEPSFLAEDGVEA
jgi:hypothetical protein